MHDALLLSFAIAIGSIVIGIQQLRIASRGSYRPEEPGPLLTKEMSVPDVLSESQRQRIKFWAYCCFGIGALGLVLCLAFVFRSH
jgi:hypothetical protein